MLRSWLLEKVLYFESDTSVGLHEESVCLWSNKEPDSFSVTVQQPKIWFEETKYRELINSDVCVGVPRVSSLQVVWFWLPALGEKRKKSRKTEL